jgi:hypothetical protein
MASFTSTTVTIPGYSPSITVVVGGELDLSNEEAINVVEADNVTGFLIPLLIAAGVPHEIVIPAAVVVQGASPEVHLINLIGGNNGVRVIFLIAGGGPVVLPRPAS